MNGYSIMLFFHIAGVLGFTLALGLEWTGLWEIRNAKAIQQVREWMKILKSVRKVGFFSMLITVITGLYMVLAGWGGEAWIYVTLGSLVLVIVLSTALTGPRMSAIGKALAVEKEKLPVNFHNLSNQTLLWISIHTRAGISLGIVFLKVAKPDLAGSLLIIGAAILLGVLSALPVIHREHAQEGERLWT